MVAFTLAKKLCSNCWTLRFVESYLAVVDRFVVKSSRDPHPGPNPASTEVTDTPSTSLTASASGAPDCLNVVAPSRPNLNFFPKGKNNCCFRPGWFRTHTRTNRGIELSFKGC